MNNEILNNKKLATHVNFTRMDPEARKALLVKATLACLKKHGFQGLSVRKICTQAGVSLGLISHYYSGKDALVAEAYQTITDEVMTQLTVAMAENAGQGVRQQLSAFFQASFSKQLLNTFLLEAWLAFWGAVRTSDSIRQAHDRSYTSYRSILEQALEQLSTEQGWDNFNYELAAISLTAVIDGLWLEHGLDPNIFTPDEGIKICEAWVDGLIAGGYKRLCK